MRCVKSVSSSSLLLLTTAAISDLGWARLHCREGRLDRAEAGYRYLLEVLAALAPPLTAKAYAPSVSELDAPR